jgi:tol-pal system protein YbgF
MIRRSSFAALLCAPLLVGCFTKYEGDQLRKDVTELEGRVATIEKRDSDLTAATRDAKDQVARLKEVLEEATRLVTRTSADFGLRVQKLTEDLTALSGKVDEVAHGLEAMQKDEQTWRAQADVKLEALGSRPGAATASPGAAGAVPGGAAPAAPPGKDALFSQAQQRLAAGDHEEARRLLRQFLSQFPQDPRAAQAQLLHGESYFQQKKFAAAIGEFQKVIDNHPRSPAVEEAMYKVGVSFLELHFCTDAKTVFGEALKRYPRGPNAAAIQRSLAEIQKNGRNRRVCSN